MHNFCRPTKNVASLLARIKRAKLLIEELPVSRSHIESIQRRAILKSAVFSARIEGNPLRPSDVSLSSIEKPSPEMRRREIGNLVRAIRFVSSPSAPKHLSLSFIKRLHAIVMNGLRRDAGYFRIEPSAVFTDGGVALYVAPSPMEVKPLLLELVGYIRSSKDSTPVVASIAHIWFEKIHPFLDGNGRVGRLLFSYLLSRGGYGMRGAVPFEEYIDDHRDEYYDVLRPNRRDVTPAVEFLLEALATTAEKTVDQLKQPLQEEQKTILFPRRQEILNIIRDHRVVSFDFLQRRFIAVPTSTLHYDLKQLLKDRLIKKIGRTRGAQYTVPV